MFDVQKRIYGNLFPQGNGFQAWYTALFFQVMAFFGLRYFEPMASDKYFRARIARSVAPTRR